MAVGAQGQGLGRERERKEGEDKEKGGQMNTTDKQLKRKPYKSKQSGKGNSKTGEAQNQGEKQDQLGVEGREGTMITLFFFLLKRQVCQQH